MTRDVAPLNNGSAAVDELSSLFRGFPPSANCEVHFFSAADDKCPTFASLSLSFIKYLRITASDGRSCGKKCT